MTISEGGAGVSTDGGGRPRWDWSNPDGRRALDAGVLRVLAGEDDEGTPDCSRAVVADGLRIDGSEAALRAVGRACGRLVAAGLALEKGERGKRTYRVSAKGRRAVDKGAGR